jgi:hypothetical protein
VAREERDRRKRLKIGYRKIQINGEWFIWDEREEKLRKRYYRREQMGRAWGKKRKEKVKSYREGCMERKVHIGNKWWKIMTIYSKEMKTTRRRVEDAMEENREECMLMGGGDFNGRIGERGAEEGREDGKRKSKDKVKNAEGKRLMEWIEENGWEVLNGNKQRDEEGEWTYFGNREETVIDYGIVNEEAWEGVEEVRIGERAEADHLEIALRKRRGGKNREGKGWGTGIKLFTYFFFGIAFYV